MSEWVASSRAIVAKLFGYSETAVQKWQALGMPGEPRHYDLAAIIQWRERYWKERLEAVTSDEPMLAGDVSNSPALERYREEKAQLAKLDRLERTRELLDRQLVVEALYRLGSLLRRVGDQLQRKYGPGAHDQIERALDEFERIVSEEFSDRGSDSEDE